MTNSRLFQHVRRFLTSPQGQATIFAVLVVVTAGCSGVLPGDSNVGNEPLDDVPQDVDVVMFFDSGIIQDQTTVDTANGIIELAQEQSSNYQGPESYEEALSEAESESNLSVDGFNSMLVYGKSGQSQYGAVIMQTDYTVEELRQASENNMGDVQEDTYSGVDVYITQSPTGEASWLADLGDGKFIAGTEQAVKDGIDTNQGNQDAFSGELRNAYNSVDDGYVKAAVNVSATQSAGAAGPTAGGPMQSSNNVEIMTMVYYTDGNNMNLDAQLTATNESAASTLQTDISDGVDSLPLLVGQMMEGDNEAVRNMVENIEVSQDGSNVVINFQTNPDQVVAVFEALGSQSAGPGAGPGVGNQPVLPVEDSTFEVTG